MNQEQIAQEIEKLAQTWAAAEVRRDTAFMEQILANGFGNTQYHCKDCGAYCVLKPVQVYSETEQQLVLRACLERCSLRGIARIFAIARQTIVRWFREHWRPKQSNLSRSYGKLSRMNRSTAILSVIFSLFITTCFQLKPIIVLGRKLGRLRLWNAGTIRCVNAEAAMFDKHCPFLASDEYHRLITLAFNVQYNSSLSLTN